MPARHRASQIVAVGLIGFLAIIALSWANELFGLPSLIFGGGHRVNWPESVLETAIIALVAIPVLVLTRRLVEEFFGSIRTGDNRKNWQTPGQVGKSWQSDCPRKNAHEGQSRAQFPGPGLTPEP